MAALAIDFDKLLSATDVVNEVFLGVELSPQLIRVGDL